MRWIIAAIVFLELLMPNLVADPSFELQSSAWDRTFGSFSTDYQAKAGRYVMELTANVPRGIPGRADQDLTLSAGVPHFVSAWGRQITEGAPLRLLLGGVELAKIENDEATGEWQRLVAIREPAVSSVRLRIEAALGAFPGSSVWIIDDVEVYEMAITNQIKSAIITDLQTITAANGYSTTIGEAGVEPRDIDQAKFPAAYIVPGTGGVSEIETLGNITGLATQNYVLQLVVRSTTPNADLDAFLDDVRNAIETSSSSVMGISDVEMAGVSDWDEIVTSETIHGDVYIRQVTVSVRYLFTRGSA